MGAGEMVDVGRNSDGVMVSRLRPVRPAFEVHENGLKSLRWPYN